VSEELGRTGIRRDVAVAVVLALGAICITAVGLLGIRTREAVLALLGAYAITALLSDRLALFGFIAMLGAQFYFPLVPGITVAFSEMLAGVFIGVVLSRQFVRGSVAFPATPLGILVILYGLGNALYLLNSGFASDAIRYAGRGALLAGTFWAMRAVLLRETPALRTTLLLLVPVALFSFVVQFAMVALFGGPDGLPFYVLYVQIPSAAGVFPPIRDDLIPTMLLYPEARPGSYLDPYGGAYGVYLLAILPLLTLSTLQQPRRMRIFGWIAVAACALALAFTQSRTGVYAAVGGMIVLGVMTRKMLKMTVTLGVLTVLVAISANDYMSARLLSQTGSAISSAEGRFREYAPQAISNGLSSPILGGGLQAFDKSRGGVLPHNQFLSDFQGRGFTGLLLGILLFTAAGALAWTLGRQALPRDEHFATVWAGAVIASYFLACLATTPADYVQLIAPLMLALAALDVIAVRHAVVLWPTTLRNEGVDLATGPMATGASSL
jgi:hypothetical protein